MNTKTKRILVCVGIGLAFFFLTWLLTTTISNHLNMEKENTEMVCGDTLTSQGKVLEFEYGKHKFINIVKLDKDGKKESFVVHDPNCKCTSKKLNNITTVITNTDNHNSHASDSISKANFRVIISKLDNLTKEVNTLRNEVATLKKSQNKQNQQKKVVKVVKKQTKR